MPDLVHKYLNLCANTQVLIFCFSPYIKLDTVPVATLSLLSLQPYMIHNLPLFSSLIVLYLQFHKHKARTEQNHLTHA